MACRDLLAFVVACSTALAAQSNAQAPPAAGLRQTATVKASNPGMFDHFGEGGVLDGHIGNGVAISADGNTMAVGAQHESSGAPGINGNQNDESAYNAGAVYVYAREGANWTQRAYVKASNAGAGDHFGSSVALSADGNTMAVAAYWESSAATGVNGDQADNSIPNAGAAYIFARSGTTWTQQAYIKASNTGTAAVDGVQSDGDQYAFSLALSGDGNTLAVGAITEDSNATGFDGNGADDSAASAGAVYVYTRTGASWSQQAYVKSPPADGDPTGGDMFGYSLRLDDDGDTLVVGVYDEDGSSRAINGPVDGERGGAGAAYVFTRAGTTWSRQAYIKVANAEGGDSWGVDVALSADGNTLAIGTADEDCDATGVNPPGCGDEDLGSAGGSMGAAAIFVRDGTTWTQQAYLKASNTGWEDWFGIKLALSGDGNTLAVAAPNEDSATQGINGRQDDESAIEAGAVYLFTRGGTEWVQRAYVKGSNTKAFDEFGGAVALNGDGRILLVGARGEDSGAQGTNGNQVDESGAVYVFTR
jgi:hypothetical protein